MRPILGLFAALLVACSAPLQPDGAPLSTHDRPPTPPASAPKDPTSPPTPATSPPTAPASASAPVASAPASAPSEWEGFAAYPGARLLCREHVSAAQMHIEWASYATAAPPKEVITFYRAHAGAATPGTTGEFSLQQGEVRLSVHKRGDTYPRCEVSPAPGEQTVIVVSRAIR